jgi:hypothetical protein
VRGDITTMDRITALLTDGRNPQSLAARIRAKRWERLLGEFPDFTQMRVLDLGGTPGDWRAAPHRPAAVTVVNIDRNHCVGEQPSFVTAVHGDACGLPAHIRADRFDLVISNSVLEHVGGHTQRCRFADAVRESAPRHWVQTPYRYFPLEPHWLFPGFQFLPVNARIQLTMRWPFGHLHADTTEAAAAMVQEVELLSITQMRGYFPGSEIWMERLAGLPKSLVAINS